MLHDNFEVMNDFLDMIAFNNRRIAEIHSFNTSLSAFLFSHIGGNAQKDDAKAITKLGIMNMKRCKSIISNTAIIKDLGLNICFLCDCANDFPKIFDLIFDNKSENLDIIYQIKKNRKISAESIIREVISLKSIDKVEECFCRMNIEYDD